MKHAPAIGLLLGLLALNVAPDAPGIPTVPLRSAPLPDLRVVSNVRYGDAAGQALLLDSYVPPTSGHARPAVILVPGEGWRYGDKADDAPEARRLAREGWAAFAINYRLTARHPFPDEFHDVRTAISWVRAHAARFGVDPARLAVLGTATGGNLAVLAATVGTGALGAGTRVRAAVSWSGAMDLTTLATAALARCRAGGDCREAHAILRYMGCQPRACPARYRAASPVAQIDRTDPPIFLANGGAESVPLSQARDMAARLQSAGVPYQFDVIPGHGHGMDYADAVWSRTIRFLRTYLGRPPGPERIAPPMPTPTLVATSMSTPMATATPTPSSVATGTPTMTPTMTPTAPPTPQPGTVLYSADWSRGLNGWTGSPDWSASGGLLMSDGTSHINGESDTYLTIMAPYQLGPLANYAVEARIAVVRGEDINQYDFGIGARAGPLGVYRAGVSYPCNAACGDAGSGFSPLAIIAAGRIDRIGDIASNVLAQQKFDPGTSVHTYRLEVKGASIALLIDGQPALSATDDRFSAGGRVGLWSNAVQLTVGDFKVVAL